MSMAVLFIIPQNHKQSKWPSTGKERTNVIHPYHKPYSAIRRNTALPRATTRINLKRNWSRYERLYIADFHLYAVLTKAYF